MSRISIYGGRKTYRFVNKAKSALITDLCRIQETFPAGSGIKRLLLCTPNPGVWGVKPSGRNNKKKRKGGVPSIAGGAPEDAASRCNRRGWKAISAL